LFIAKDLPVVAWNRLHLPAAPQKRGRPRNNNGYFTKYHKKAKKSRTDFEALDPLDEEEMILREEAEHLKAAIRE
jgi:IMP cyclohydrolase